MKVIAVGDLHLKMVPNVPKQWQIDRYEEFIDNLISDCVDKRAILALCGDTLDSIDPKKEELRLFMYLMHELHNNGVTTLLVSGNHESLKAGESILDYLEVDRFENVFYRTSPTFLGVTFHLVNHDSIHSYTPKFIEGKNILISHARCNVPPHIKEEIDFKKFTKGYDICVLGDIHMPMAFGNVIYTNNPVNKEFEYEPDCGYVSLDIDSGINVARKTLDYPHLVYRKRNADDVYLASFEGYKDFFKIDVEGTPEELRAIKDIPENVRVCKIPKLEKHLEVKVEESLTEEAVDTPDDLKSYMKSLGYSDSLIADMMAELRREL